MPSRAFTVMGTGGFQPVATSLDTSPFSSDTRSLPFASRTTLVGGTSGREYASTRYLPDSDSVTSWSASSGVSSVKALAVHSDLVEVAEVRVAPLLLADALEVQRARLLIDAHELRDVALRRS